MPSTRTEFWQSKIEKNRINDHKSQKALIDSGWRVAVVWECSVREKHATTNQHEDSALRLINWLKSSSISIELPARK
jgi:DNA mismatch endonuclease (patch repair protein)